MTKLRKGISAPSDHLVVVTSAQQRYVVSHIAEVLREQPARIRCVGGLPPRIARAIRTRCCTMIRDLDAGRSARHPAHDGTLHADVVLPRKPGLGRLSDDVEASGLRGSRQIQTGAISVVGASYAPTVGSTVLTSANRRLTAGKRIRVRRRTHGYIVRVGVHIGSLHRELRLGISTFHIAAAERSTYQRSIRRSRRRGRLRTRNCLLVQMSRLLI